MAKVFSKEDVIQTKKEAIKSLNKLLELYINDSSDKHLKKAHLISYWLKDYANMIRFEEKFDPTKNIAYKRGNIVKLNFGFNIGSEYGGLHYGIVLDNKNDHHSPVVTIIPLTSMKNNKTLHKNSVDLGNEIYRSLKLKYDTVSRSLKEEKGSIIETTSAISALVDLTQEALVEIDQYEKNSSEYFQKSKIAATCVKTAHKLKEEWDEKGKHNSIEQAYLNKIGAEISQMKEGSIALVNQITTVSKIRIFDPRNLKGVLAGVSLTEESMEKINEKVKELYVF